MENLLKQYIELGNNIAGVPHDPRPQVDQRPMPVVDINRATEIPSVTMEKRQNKNDFYRFLLQQNQGGLTESQQMLKNMQQRANNDILIPRSILKKCEKKASTSKLVEEEPEPEVQGVQLKRNNPLLSPKFNQFWRDK